MSDQPEGSRHVLVDSSIVSGLQGRYATALYELARDAAVLPQVEADLTSLKAAIDGSRDLTRLIKSPAISRDNQWKALDAVAVAMQLSDATRRFLGVVTQNRRLFVLPSIIDAFIKLAAHFRGEMTATITTAAEITSQQEQQIADALRQVFGRDVKITKSLDKDLLGGIVVRVGSLMVDSSVRTQLNQLQSAMREVS